MWCVVHANIGLTRNISVPLCMWVYNQCTSLHYLILSTSLCAEAVHYGKKKLFYTRET